MDILRRLAASYVTVSTSMSVYFDSVQLFKLQHMNSYNLSYYESGGSFTESGGS